MCGCLCNYRPSTKYNGKVIFSVCLSVHQEGTLLSGPRSFPGDWVHQSLVPGPFSGGWGTPVRNYPPPARTRTGRGDGYPSQALGQGTSSLQARSSMGEGRDYPSQVPGQGTPLPPDSTRHGLDTPRMVHLLWSCKRTFLLQMLSLSALATHTCLMSVSKYVKYYFGNIAGLGQYVKIVQENSF